MPGVVSRSARCCLNSETCPQSLPRRSSPRSGSQPVVVLPAADCGIGGVGTEGKRERGRSAASWCKPFARARAESRLDGTPEYALRHVCPPPCGVPANAGQPLEAADRLPAPTRIPGSRSLKEEDVSVGKLRALKPRRPGRLPAGRDVCVRRGSAESARQACRSAGSNAGRPARASFKRI